MADYKLSSGGVRRASDGAFIPDDPRNRDWVAYQEWLTAGNLPDPEFTAEELAAQAARAVENAAVTTLDTEARADAIFTTLKTATGAQIATFVSSQFPLFTAQQRAIVRMLLHIAALTLRRGGV